jgi:hypothetical protein
MDICQTFSAKIGNDAVFHICIEHSQSWPSTWTKRNKIQKLEKIHYHVPVTIQQK